MKLLLATGNMGKLREFRRMFPDDTILSTKDVGVSLDVEENGKTFAENAAIKARALFELTGIPTIADDSGIVIDAMNGFPGVYSARYASEDVCCEKVLDYLAGVPAEKRSARYVCSICFVKARGEEYTVDGTCEGAIGFGKSGSRGFGYDPIFYVGRQSMAQMTDEEKDAISHRGVALRKLKILFEEQNICE